LLYLLVLTLTLIKLIFNYSSCLQFNKTIVKKGA
jgi:hypothetical protein